MALCLVLASCGGDETPRGLEGDEGDEEPILVRVSVRLDADATRVTPRRVAAFLPLRFEVDSEVDGVVRIRGVGRRPVGPDTRAVLRSPGLEPGRVRISGPGGAALLRVRSGG